MRRHSRIHFLAGVFAVFLSGGRAHALPSLSTGTQFLPADGARTAMDIGGSWNGSTDVRASAGDGFRFTLTNGSLATSAFDLAIAVQLPSNFQYVAGTGSVSASGAGCGAAPTATASQVGTTLTFTILPAGYDLPADCALTFAYGLVADTTVAAGTYAVQPSWNYSNTNAGPLVGVQNVAQQIVVRAGASLFTLSPSTQTKAVGQTANFTASVCNSGLGGLFDVTIDETLLNPNPANSLQITSMTQTAPLVPAATGTMPVLTVPYLAPGACFNASIAADVTGCSTIVNTASTDDRTGTTASNVLASVTLDLTTPLISYSPGSVSVPYTGTQTVNIPIQNTGLGTAYGTVLQTNLDLLPLSVTNVSAGWSYNASNGNFTRVGGTVLNGATVPLSFDVEQTSCPPIDNSYTIVWQSSYLDGCTNPYVVPSVLQSVSIGGTEPLNVSVTGPSRVNLNQSGTWNVTLTPNDLSQLTTPNIVVTETIPAGFFRSGAGNHSPGHHGELRRPLRPRHLGHVDGSEDRPHRSPHAAHQFHGTK